MPCRPGKHHLLSLTASCFPSVQLRQVARALERPQSQLCQLSHRRRPAWLHPCLATAAQQSQHASSALQTSRLTYHVITPAMYESLLLSCEPIRMLARTTCAALHKQLNMPLAICQPLLELSVTICIYLMPGLSDNPLLPSGRPCPGKGCRCPKSS